MQHQSSKIWFMNPALSDDKNLVISAHATHPQNLVILQEDLAWVRPALRSNAKFEKFKKDHSKAAHSPLCDASWSDNYAIRGGKRMMPLIIYQAPPASRKNPDRIVATEDRNPVVNANVQQAPARPSAKISTQVSDHLKYLEVSE